jgi:hypothetical protein
MKKRKKGGMCLLGEEFLKSSQGCCVGFDLATRKKKKLILVVYTVRGGFLDSLWFILMFSFIILSI